MTREEALKICNTVIMFGRCDCPKKEGEEFFKIVKESLKQEPKSEWRHDHEILKAYGDGANEALDKVRAEIENDWQLKKYPSSPFSCGLRRAIEIIDMYKTEYTNT